MQNSSCTGSAATTGLGSGGQEPPDSPNQPSCAPKSALHSCSSASASTPYGAAPSITPCRVLSQHKQLPEPSTLGAKAASRLPQQASLAPRMH